MITSWSTLFLQTGGPWTLSEYREMYQWEARKQYTRSCVSCGVPAPETDIRIVHPDTSVELPVGYLGEVWINSPRLVMCFPLEHDNDHRITGIGT